MNFLPQKLNSLASVKETKHAGLDNSALHGTLLTRQPFPGCLQTTHCGTKCSRNNHGHPLATRWQHLQLALNVFRMLSKLRGLFRDPVFLLSVKTIYRVGTKALWVAATTGLNYYWLKPALCTLKPIPAEESLLLSLSCHVGYHVLHQGGLIPSKKTPGAGLHDPDPSNSAYSRIQ